MIRIALAGLVLNKVITKKQGDYIYKRLKSEKIPDSVLETVKKIEFYKIEFYREKLINNRTCQVCNKPLTGRKTKNCSTYCQNKLAREKLKWNTK